MNNVTIVFPKQEMRFYFLMSDLQLQEQPTEETTREPIAMESVTLKRTIVVKSQVTDTFRERANGELGEEVKTIDQQLSQLENQYQQSLQQLENLTRQGQNVARQLDQLHKEYIGKRQQLHNLKGEVSTQLRNLDKVQNGEYVITGQLENFVDVKIGDNLYDKIRGAEILINDGMITAILG
jgi:chromosome segregation ATPase